MYKRLGIAAAAIVGLLYFFYATSLPFTLTQFFLQLSGFEATGFSGNLSEGRIHIAHYRDATFQKVFAIEDLDLQFIPLKWSKQPVFHVKNSSAKSIGSERLTRKRLNREETAGEIQKFLEKLQKNEISLELNQGLIIERLAVDNLKYVASRRSKPLEAKGFLLKDFRVQQGGGYSLASLEVSGEAFHIQASKASVEDKLKLFAEVHLPPDLFESGQIDLSLKSPDAQASGLAH